MINKLSMMMMTVIIITIIIIKIIIIIIIIIIITACTIFQDAVNFKYKQKDLYKNIKI